MARVKYLTINASKMINHYYRSLSLKDIPNFHASGSIKGMKKQFYGEGALLVRSGSYIYNVTQYPLIYEILAG